MFKQIYSYFELFGEFYGFDSIEEEEGKRSSSLRNAWFEISLNFSQILRAGFHSFAQETVVLR